MYEKRERKISIAFNFLFPTFIFFLFATLKNNKKLISIPLNAGYRKSEIFKCRFNF